MAKAQLGLVMWQGLSLGSISILRCRRTCPPPPHPAGPDPNVSSPQSNSSAQPKSFFVNMGLKVIFLTGISVVATFCAPCKLAYSGLGYCVTHLLHIISRAKQAYVLAYSAHSAYCMLYLACLRVYSVHKGHTLNFIYF